MGSHRSIRMRLVGLGAVTLMAGTLAACGGGAGPADPTGVDELVIPTPSPDPDDFVRRVTNPRFPLPAGATWTLEGAYGQEPATLELRVETGGEIAGVRTTSLRTVLTVAPPVPDPERRRPAVTEPLLEVVDYFAQDASGNVWWFGREGEWAAGTVGAEAGLMMPAEPRFGDGFISAGVPGDPIVSEVVDVDAEATTPLDTFGPTVVIRTGTDGPLATIESAYAAGAGLVYVRTAEESGTFGDPEIELALTATTVE